VSNILSLDACTAECAERVGGKAVGLGSLLRQGLRVPEGFVVTTDAYRAGVIFPGLHAEAVWMLRDANTTDAQRLASERIRAMFERAELAEQIGSEIAIAYSRLAAGRSSPPVAVRSSATDEDRADASFAGQQETYLWIQGEAAVARRVMSCWGSLFTPQAISYRAHLGVSIDKLAMAVVVQEMVPAESAGVMITLDPVNGDRSAITIESSFGVGLGVVGGEVTPDRFVVDKVTFEIRSRSIGPKAIAYRFAPDLGTVVQTGVARDEQYLPSLTDDEVVDLAHIGRALERGQGGPQDVEWAIGPGPTGPRQIALLQMRPETVWSRRPVAPISDPRTPILIRMLQSMSTPLKIRDVAVKDTGGEPSTATIDCT
jgi:rifampicin phosphotransferase